MLQAALCRFGQSAKTSEFNCCGFLPRIWAKWLALLHCAMNCAQTPIFGKPCVISVLSQSIKTENVQAAEGVRTLLFALAHSVSFFTASANSQPSHVNRKIKACVACRGLSLGASAACTKPASCNHCAWAANMDISIPGKPLNGWSIGVSIVAKMMVRIKSISLFMSDPFFGFWCVRSPLSVVGGARPLSTHRAQAWCAVRGDFLPVTFATHGQVRGNLGAGAVGGFYALHGRSVFGFALLANHQVFRKVVA